jgi:hypothetical protein
MNCSAMPRPAATPAPSEARRPRWSSKYSSRLDGSQSNSGRYSRLRLAPSAVNQKVSEKQKKAL